MNIAKKKSNKFVMNILDNFSLESFKYDLYVLNNIQNGLDDLENGRYVTQKEVEDYLKRWIIK